MKINYNRTEICNQMHDALRNVKGGTCVITEYIMHARNM